MNGIYCNNCGAELDEAPSLLPDLRPPCPRCGSLARRFEKTISSTLFLSDNGTGTDAITVTKTGGSDVLVQAQAAEAVGEALPPTVQTVEAHGISEAGQSGNPTVIRDDRVIRDHLVVMGRSVWWTQLTEDGGWMVQVVDEVGEVLAIATKYDPVEALAAVAEFVLPGHPG